MGKYKRYSEKEKSDAIELANRIGISAAARQTGITRRTIQKWYSEYKKNNKNFTDFPSKKEPDLVELFRTSIKELYKYSTDELLRVVQSENFKNKATIQQKITLFGVVADKLLRFIGTGQNEKISDKEINELSIKILPMRELKENVKK